MRAAVLLCGIVLSKAGSNVLRATVLLCGIVLSKQAGSNVLRAAILLCGIVLSKLAPMSCELQCCNFALRNS
jgi:hypothetical protein